MSIQITEGWGKLDMILAMFDPVLPDGKVRTYRVTIDRLLGGPTEYCETTLYECKRIRGGELWEITGQVKLPQEDRYREITGTYSTFNRHGTMDVAD